MSELLIRHGEWVVVCDGAKALVLENTGDAKFPNLKTVEVFEQKDLPTHLLGADKPGRTHSSAGPGSSAVTADRLAQSGRTGLPHSSRPTARRCQVAAGKVKSLILVAPATCSRHDPPCLFARLAWRHSC